MSKEQSVAPKERVNITYKPATGDAQEEVELPLRILMMGDYTGKRDDTPLEERKPGKLGLHLVLRLVDSMQYEYSTERRESRTTFRKTGARRAVSGGI